MPGVLVLSEDLSLGNILARALLAHGIAARNAELRLEVLRALDALLPEAVVLQIPPGVVGRAYLAELETRRFAGRVIVVSAEPEVQPLSGAFRLLRPWQLDELLRALSG